MTSPETSELPAATPPPAPPILQPPQHVVLDLPEEEPGWQAPEEVRQPRRSRSAPQPPEPAPEGVPVFGTRKDEEQKPRETRTFALEVEYRERNRQVRANALFTAHTTLDAGAVLRMMQARTELEQANATAFVLTTALLDDDGVPATWSVPSIEEPALEDEDDLDSRALRGEPTEVDPDGPLLYERWDGELVPYDDLAFSEWEDGSSRRRFAFIMSSPGHRVELPALIEVSKWLIQEAGGRPTGRPTPSGRGPQSTRRGSGGKRR